MREAGSDAPEGRSGGSQKAWTVLDVIRWCARYLGEKGVPEPRLDAERMLAHALRLTRLQLYLQYDRPLASTELAAFKAYLRRRARREPLQYILGRASFRELEIRVDRRVLIPRHETEGLVEEILRWARAGGRTNLRALDVGTGSGAVALSLLTEGPFDSVVATDRSPKALEVAGENAGLSGLSARLDLREGDLFDPVRPGERFDVVVSNPPYVTEAEFSNELEPEVAQWEPREALVAGSTGLEVIRRLVEGAPGILRSGGLLALEIGASQGAAARSVALQVAGLSEPIITKDLSRRDRYLLAVRAEDPRPSVKPMEGEAVHVSHT